MKKRVLSFYLVFAFSLVSVLSMLVSAEFESTIQQSAAIEKISPTPLSKEMSQSSTAKIEGQSAQLMSVPVITILWPESGYYYTTDSLVLWITTPGPAICSFSFDGVNFQEMEIRENGDTDHSHEVYHLGDNMEGDPYILTFRCVNDQSEESSAEAYFWINSNPLDLYFLRYNLENWPYLFSSISWEGNDNGLLEVYRAYYGQEEPGVYTKVIYNLFDSEQSLQTNLPEYLSTIMGDTYQLRVIDSNNTYSGRSQPSRFIAWPSQNKLIVLQTFAYENTTPVDISVPLEVVRPYLIRYPSTLRYGVCGDGRVDVNNNEEFREQCDGNVQNRSCGTDVGECVRGIENRNCNQNCTWGVWRNCTAVTPKPEKCDSLDNDCDAQTDETYPSLGQDCTVGIGACMRSGHQICAAGGNATRCDATPGQPSIELCLDGIDNDCDGLTDLFDTANCTALQILSPAGKNYKTKNILLNLVGGNFVQEIHYKFLDNDGKESSGRLCTKCSSYNKTKSFKDGTYSATFFVSANKTILAQKNVTFLVDSTKPKIKSVYPKKGWVNGSFSVTLSEENLLTVILYYNSTRKILNKSGECSTEDSEITCLTKVNLRSFENKQIPFWFEITDVANNSGASKSASLSVDTVAPNITKLNITAVPGKINFWINVSELNFDNLYYTDLNSSKVSEKVLCSKLKQNICEVKKSFSSGIHSIDLRISDAADNSYKKRISVLVP